MATTELSPLSVSLFMGGASDDLEGGLPRPREVGLVGFEEVLHRFLDFFGRIFHADISGRPRHDNTGRCYQLEHQYKSTPTRNSAITRDYRAHVQHENVVASLCSVATPHANAYIAMTTSINI